MAGITYPYPPILIALKPILAAEKERLATALIRWDAYAEGLIFLKDRTKFGISNFLRFSNLTVGILREYELFSNLL
jgi:hypothetical protein